MAAPTPMMTVLSVETGHVLSVVVAGALAPTVDDLTGGSHLAVRVPVGEPVRVTPALLTAERVPRRDDVLADPRAYQMVDGEPAWLGPPTIDAATTNLGAEGTACLVLWQVGDTLVEVRTVLNGAGRPVVGEPPGAGAGLILLRGVPLVTAS
jgi:hypothetical protein